MTEYKLSDLINVDNYKYINKYETVSSLVNKEFLITKIINHEYKNKSGYLFNIIVDGEYKIFRTTSNIIVSEVRDLLNTGKVKLDEECNILVKLISVKLNNSKWTTYKLV